ncbi:MAG TPA: alpha/beta hydrolase, partial [Kofleriaceae bacterium]|nr:alpha/beta hydrolase [Kofleriaceae bacterium]
MTLVALTERRSLGGARAVAFTSPFLALGTMKVPRFLLKLVGPMSRVVPRFAQPHRIPPEGLTHDRAQVETAGNDPLRHKVATVRWIVESSAAQAQVVRDIGRLQVPTLWMIGTGDTIASPQATLALYPNVPEPKQQILYEGLFHELVNEVERERVLDDLVAWFQRTMPLEGAGRAAGA